ncbi:MAG: hypothetical protein PUC23_00155 [bacterium]|nr:hypothetical protein [bacterium]
MNKKKLIIIFSLIILVILIGLGLYFFLNKEESDNKKFAEEYGIEEDNVFVYRTGDEIVKILENGTGIVYLGFPECPWCCAYVKYLNEVAKDEGIEKIYYYNILEDRKNNTETYKKIVSLLSDYLLYDEEGNERVFVPDVTFILNGEIIGHDNETSVITEDITPEEYWTSSKVDRLKEKLRIYMVDINNLSCSSCGV